MKSEKNRFDAFSVSSNVLVVSLIILMYGRTLMGRAHETVSNKTLKYP